MYGVVDGLCSRYGWSRQSVLTRVPVAELPYLLGAIRKSRAQEGMLQLAIACSPMSVKLAKKLRAKLQQEASQAIGRLPSPLDGASDVLLEEIKKNREKTRKTDA